MPGTKHIDKLWLRVDTQDKDIINQFIDLYVKKTYIVGFHKGKDKENKHFHAAFDLKESTPIQTVKNRVKAHFKTEKDGYCVKEWDGEDDVFSYMFHEEEVEIMISNLTDEEIAEAKAKNKVIAKKKQKREQKTHWQVIEDIRASYNSGMDNKDLWNVMMVKLEENKIRTSMFDLERIFITVKRFDKNFNADLYQKVMSKLYS
jgi:hypothetical protein